MQINNLTRKFPQLLFTFIVIMSPIFKQYTSYIPGTNLADILLVISITVIGVKGGLRLKLRKSIPLLVFLFFGGGITLLSILSQNYFSFEIFSRYFRFAFYVFVVLIGIDIFQLNFAIKTYKLTAHLISIFVVLQVLLYKLFNFILPIKILPLPWAGNVSITVQDIYNSANLYFYRPSGIFIEPGYLVQFLLPALIFSLYGWTKSKKINIQSMIIILSAILLSTSTQGVFLSALIFIIFLLLKIYKSRSLLDLKKSLIILGSLLLGGSYFVTTSTFKFAIAKLFSVRLVSSTTLRLFRGFSVYLKLPFLNKLIGVGHGNLGYFVIKHNISTIFDPQNLTVRFADYANGISATLLYYGIFGFVLLLIVYYSMLKNTTEAFFLIVITQIMLTFVEGALFNISIVFYFTLIYSGYKNRRVIQVRKNKVFKE